jgi:hypothetical protein
VGGVVLADAAWHEEALDDTQDCGDACPEEDEIQDACGVSAEVKMVDTECAKEECEQDASRLVFVGAFVLGIEPAALLVGHAGSVERICNLHDFAPLEECKKKYVAKWAAVPDCRRFASVQQLYADLIGRNLQAISEGVEFRQIMMCDATARRDRESD